MVRAKFLDVTAHACRPRQQPAIVSIVAALSATRCAERGPVDMHGVAVVAEAVEERCWEVWSYDQDGLLLSYTNDIGLDCVIDESETWTYNDQGEPLMYHKVDYQGFQGEVLQTGTSVNNDAAI